MVVTKTIKLKSRGETDVIDITDKVASGISDSRLKKGTVTVFVTGSTGGLTTIEYEPGLVEDLREAFQIVAPRDGEYHHNLRWQDGNGFSHVRAAMMKPSLSIPVVGGKLCLGTWQQVVFLDFDNRARKRRLVVQVIGRADG